MTRSYSAAHFVLELDQNKVVGSFRSVEGGGVRTEVLTHQMGSNHALWRQLGKPRYEDIRIQVGMSMSETFYQWIEAFFSGRTIRKNGAILAGDFQYRERARRELFEVLIGEVAIPGLDGSDRSPCYMTVTLVPERVRFAPGSARNLKAYVGTEQKLWTPNNFNFSIDGFEQACKRVTRIEGFTIKQEILEHAVGNLRDPLRVPGRIEFPNLAFFVPEADAQPFIEHFTKHVIEGKPQAQPRRTGELTLQDHDGSDLCTVSLSGVDIFNVAPEKSDAEGEEIKLVKIEISCEQMAFKYTGRRGAS